ncbi:Alpha/Beta hydrolase protein [Sporodiniella umbellata]|nr:Alpha/Beta hydrolase protein [Sporodiniella umbellata]
MNTLTAYTLYQYLQKSLSTNSLTLSSLLIQLQAKVSTAHNNKKQALAVLYPSRSNALTSLKDFFAPVKSSRKRTRRIVHKHYASTEAIKQHSHSGPLRPGYKAPREPIVLCHGLFGFDFRGPESIPALQLRYWEGVDDTLAKLGAKVIVTKVPHAGSIWERSLALHNILKSILVGKKINFVAHSMGGLDCRHLIANHCDRPYRVQSLSTVCTPHRGSPVMDWFRDHVGVGCQSYDAWSPTSSSVIHLKNAMTRDQFAPSTLTGLNKYKFDKMLLDCVDAPAYAHLTTDFCTNYFNTNTPDDPNVKYYSYGAATKFSAWKSLLNLPGKLVYEKEGENDGIVSVKSAQWGTYVKTLEADHWDFSGKR